LPILTAAGHVSRLRALQDPGTGLVPPFDGTGDPDASGMALVDSESPYSVLSVGYALDVLGSAFEHPITAFDELGADGTLAYLDALPWDGRPWQAGNYADALGTALLWNRRKNTPGAEATVVTRFGWLTAHTDPRTGMWGTPSPADGDLQIVNGFYRASRGSYAQFGVPLPRPRQVIDTVLAHARERRFFDRENQNACNVLDVA